jgi:hypothetical protein
MKTVKSLLLAGVAAIAASSAVQAADLRAAEPVEYVRVCDAFGAGFFFIPGTDTCLKISGYVRVQAHIHSPNYTATNADGDPTTFIAPTFNGFGVAWTRNESVTVDTFDLWTRALLRFDARSRTEWGTLRSFFEFASNGDNGAGLVVRYAFVQVGPITAGITDSFFTFNGLPTLGTVAGGPDGPTRRNVLAYTASFGNGISATVSLEDSTSIGGTGGSTTAIIGAVDGLTRYRVELPDLVGNIRVAQSWGTAQLSGAVGQYRFRDSACDIPGVGVGICTFTRTGWAVRGGAEINLGTPGSSLFLNAAYASGALQYLGNVQTAGFSQSIVNGLGLADDRNMSNATGWSVSAAYRYFFTPAIRAAVFGGYADVDMKLANFRGGAGANIVGIDQVWSVGANVVWSPVRNLDLGVEVFYTSARYQAVESSFNTANRISRFTDDGWGAIFRIQRNF